MKKYSTNFIKNYIEEHKLDIDYVECGMQEDWLWTCETVYKKGEFVDGYDWQSKHLSVNGISGSSWATPVMRVNFKDGNTEIIECYVDDGAHENLSQIAWQKTFAAMTGGMDSVWERS